MTSTQLATLLGLALHVSLQAGLIARVLLRPHRQPSSRIAWVVAILSVPLAGMIAYVLLGEVNVGRRRARRLQLAQARLPSLACDGDTDRLHAEIPERCAHLFATGRSISGFPPVGGNRGELLEDSNRSVEAMVADIDAARDQVHLLFYIWLPDHNGTRMAEALTRAALRGVTCRAIADDLGSRALIRSRLWREMRAAGVRLARALPIGNPLLRPLQGRIDLRNHRKILVVDDRITYCGSQNCADPEFRVKAKYAPWVDLMIRFEGPVALQNQRLFASDWMAHVDEDLSDLLCQPLPVEGPGLPAQVIGTGPTQRYSAMPELFESLMYGARRELVISTPYYVPDEGMQGALCAAGQRGVNTRLILPRRNDSWVVAAASRSYYAELLDAGVRVYEYEGGLLHAKSLTLDGEVTLVGSANLDRRSFELNYENNILFYDPALTAAVRGRQESYLARSHPVERRQVDAWSTGHRLFNNTIALFGPVL